MKSVVTLSSPLSETAARLAQQHGISLDQLFNKAVEDYVHAHSRRGRYDGVTDALNRVYAADPGAGLAGLVGLWEDGDEFAAELERVRLFWDMTYRPCFQ